MEEDAIQVMNALRQEDMMEQEEDMELEQAIIESYVPDPST